MPLQSHAPDDRTGSKWWAGALRRSAVFLGLGVGLPGCIEYADPQVPCGARELRSDDAPAWLAPRQAPVVALSAPDDPVVVHPVCAPD